MFDNIPRWTFQENKNYPGRARHNCDNYLGPGIGYVRKNGKISCSMCGAVLPEILELPAKVFGAYKYLSFTAKAEYKRSFGAR